MIPSSNRAALTLKTRSRTDATDQPMTSPDAVLVVTDDLKTQNRLQDLLDATGYRALFATGLEQTLQLIGDSGAQLLIIDGGKANTIGLSLARQLRESDIHPRIYAILLADNPSGFDVAAAMRAGIDDVLFNTVLTEQLMLGLENGGRVLRLNELAKQRGEQLADALDREVEAARRIKEALQAAATAQHDLLSDDDSPFPQIEIGSLFRPAGLVSSDSYNYVRLDDNHLAFYMIDTSGSELASAMLSHSIARALSQVDGGLVSQPDRREDRLNRRLPAHIVPPDRVVRALNIRFAQRGTGVDYFTMVYGVIDVRTGLGELCQAGHPHPIIVSEHNLVTPFGNGGFSVGLVEDASYDTIPFELRPGDRLFLYSDGLIHCRIRINRIFGIQRITSLLAMTRNKTLADGLALVGEKLDHWHKKKAVDDDVAIMGIGHRTTQVTP